MVPILLQLKVHPRVASATSGFTYFWIASNNFLKLLVEGLLDYELILSFTVIGVLITILSLLVDLYLLE